MNKIKAKIQDIIAVYKEAVPQKSFKESFKLSWGRFNRKEKAFAVFAFIISLGLTLRGIIPTVLAGNLDLLAIVSIIMSVFGFIGTWTLAVQWQHTFKFNGVQNVAGMMVGGMQGVYGDMFTSFYYFVTEFRGHYNWKKNRNEDGELVAKKEFGVKEIVKAVFFWTIGLGFLSYFMGGQKIILDAITNGLSFTAQQRQTGGHIDGYYLWLLVDVLSFAMFYWLGNEVVAFSYLAMMAQGFVGLMIWKKGLTD